MNLFYTFLSTIPFLTFSVGQAKTPECSSLVEMMKSGNFISDRIETVPDSIVEVKTGVFRLKHNRSVRYKMRRKYEGWNHYQCKVEVIVLQNQRVKYKEILLDEMADSWPKIYLKGDKLVLELKYDEFQSDDFTTDKRYWLIGNDCLKKLPTISK